MGTKFERLLGHYFVKFPNNDCFEFYDGNYISVCSKEVPNEPGVYIIYGCRKEKREVIYIGKGGTIYTDGIFTEQGLKKRINNTRKHDEDAQTYYTKLIADSGYDKLVFRWFVTFDSKAKTIPAYAEARLLQAFFDDNDKLPEENAGF